MASEYSRYSPYFNVKQTWYLDTMILKTMRPADDDEIYQIPTKFHHQPWRLAKEKYGNERLYYIFAVLNKDILKDPVYNFNAGITIRIPSVNRVQKYIGR